MTSNSRETGLFTPPPDGLHYVYAVLGRALALCGQFESAVERAATNIGMDRIPRDGESPDFANFVEVATRIQGARLARQIQHYVAPEDQRPFMNYLLIEAKDQRNFLAHDVPKMICGTENPTESFEYLSRLIADSATHVARGLSVVELDIPVGQVDQFVDDAGRWVISGPT